MFWIIALLCIGIIIGCIGNRQRTRGNPAKGEELILLGVVCMVLPLLVYLVYFIFHFIAG